MDDDSERPGIGPETHAPWTPGAPSASRYASPPDRPAARTHERTGGRGDAPGERVVPTDATVEDGAFAAAHRAEPNRLLRALPLEEYARLLSQLTLVPLGMRQSLIEPHVPIRDVYFPRTGVGSVIAEEQDGGPLEVGTIGPEGLIGLPVLHGVDTMPYRLFIQIPGDGWRLPADALRALVDERPAVRRVLLRYAQYVTDELSQSVACNRLHTVDERCARWLLMTHDRVHGQGFELTHEFLSLMLGVRRAGVTVAMGTLQGMGVLTYTRGRVAIVDRAGLEAASCDCYRLTRTALERLLA